LGIFTLSTHSQENGSMKKLVMLLALAVAFSLSGFAQAGGTSGSTSGGTSSTDTGKTSKGKKAKSSDMSGDMAASKKSGAKETSITGCLSSDSTPYKIANGNYKNGVEVDSTEDLKAHNGHKVKAMGSWEGTGADKKFKATSVKHVSETCTVGAGKSSAAKGEGKGKTKKGASDTTKTPS
jgi:hypothetical protein